MATIKTDKNLESKIQPFRVDKITLEKFKSIVKKNHTTMAKVFRKFMQDVNEDKIKIE